MENKSQYSKYFRCEETSAGCSLVCLECEKERIDKRYAAGPGYGTSHLRNHLLNHHRILIDTPKSGQWKRCGGIYYQCALPFTTTQSEEFKNVIQQARNFREEPVPTTSTTTEVIHTKYKKECENIKNELKTTQSASLILDHWSSNDCKNYVGVILSFVDKNFKLNCKMVDLNLVEEHGAIYTHEMLKDIAVQFGTYSKLSGVVRDSTASMLKTLELTAIDQILLTTSVYVTCFNWQ